MRLKIKFPIINHLLGLFLVLLSILIMMIIMLFWFFEIDVTAHGKGVVKCNNWIDIKPEIKGIIRKMMVKEGQWVQEGTLLFTLEDRERKLEVEATDLKIAEMKINIAKLKNQLFLAEENISGAIDEARATLAEARANYRITLKGPKPEEIRLVESKIHRAGNILDKTQKDYERMKTAYSLKLVSKLELEESYHGMKIAEVDLRLAKDELNLLRNKYDDNQIAAAKAEVNRCEAISSRTLARRIELEIFHKDLKRAEKGLLKEEKHLAVLKEHLKLTRIKAPMEGYVLTHDTEHMVGQAVEEGTVVLRLGDRREYIIDCKISEKDFPLIRIGQVAKIQIKPFPKGEYKLFKGEVISLGADINESDLPSEIGMMDKLSAFTGKQLSLKEGYFPVILRLERPYTMPLFGKIYEVRPGFSAEAEIITHHERIATFLLRRVLRIKGKLTTDKIHL